MNHRVFHGPVNIAGIGRRLADWQRQQGFIADFISYGDTAIVDKAHMDIRLAECGRLKRWTIRLFLFLYCLAQYDVFHFYSGITLLPFNLDLPVLRLLRKKIVMTYCGSEIRLIYVEARRNPYWELLKVGIDDPKFDSIKKWKMRWHRLWVHRVFAPRNLYASAREVFPEKMVVKDLWIHSAVDLAAYTPDTYRTKSPPLLVHAPSEAGIKGTIYVERAVMELQAGGYNFAYKKLENCPYEVTQRILREEADIVVDQFLLGAFGGLAVEGMYYGKPVVGYILESVKKEHYPDCPVVNASVDDLKERLIWLIENPEERVRLGREGRSFVERHFDRAKISENLWALYSEL